MKILIVVTGLGVGGAERLVCDLADRFARLGHDVVVVQLGYKVSICPIDPRVQVISLAMRRRPFSILRSLSDLRSLIRRFDPDVINSHLVHANIILRGLRAFTPMRRLVSSAHNTNEEGAHRIFAYRLTDWLADISTNVSNEAVQAFEQQGAVSPGRMMAIVNGIDELKFRFDNTSRSAVRASLDIAHDEDVLLAVGRLWPQKDYPNLFRALAHLARNKVVPRVLVAGDGPLRPELVSLVRELGLSRKVHFLGERADIQQLFSTSDFFVLSSAWEGLPLVVLEAMSCECVVIATDSGGVKGAVGDCGFVCGPRDPVALADNLYRAIQLPAEERSSLGKRARARVIEHYSLDSMAKRYLAIYQGTPD